MRWGARVRSRCARAREIEREFASVGCHGTAWRAIDILALGCVAVAAVLLPPVLFWGLPLPWCVLLPLLRCGRAAAIRQSAHIDDRGLIAGQPAQVDHRVVDERELRRGRGRFLTGRRLLGQPQHVGGRRRHRTTLNAPALRPLSSVESHQLKNAGCAGGHYSRPVSGHLPPPFCAAPGATVSGGRPFDEVP